MIDFECQCGAIYHSEEAHIGRCLRCIKCGSPVPILRAERSVVPASTGSPEVQRQLAVVRPKRQGSERHRTLCTRTAAAIILLISLGLLLRAAVGIIDLLLARSRRNLMQAMVARSLQSGPGPSAFEVVEVTRLEAEPSRI